MSDEHDELRSFRSAWWQRHIDDFVFVRGPLAADRPSWELTRFAVLRLLGLVYFVAFLSLVVQLEPLLGSGGLLPVERFLNAVHHRFGGGAYWRVPTLFWFGCSDGAMRAFAWTGVALSAAAMLGATNAALQLVLWVLYLSFVHVGQIFYGYGWEIQLLETGMLAVFLCPWNDVRPFPKTATPPIVLWLLRWLVFRVMLGAGLIKLRGDSCWRDLSCLDFHFETQPNPNPLAWWLHHGPHGAHVIGVLFNHLVELVVPWFALFGTRRWRTTAGLLLAIFQVTLIVSGNLSFLNWLTIVPALACIDDEAWARLVPRRLRERVLARARSALPNLIHTRATQVYAVVVGLLSVPPILNLVSCEQAMNTSFEPFELVNTYGAFGSVDRKRFEVVIEGTRDEEPSAQTHWEEYELPCQPGDVRRAPCVVSPWQWRLDWQMWFVGNGAVRGETIEQDPWLVHLVWQLLRGAPGPQKLLARDPFAGVPPKWIRIGVWRYRFSDTRAGGAWWQRERLGTYMRPVSLDTLELAEYVGSYGWTE
jgi:hypothetical protein